MKIHLALTLLFSATGVAFGGAPPLLKEDFDNYSSAAEIVDPAGGGWTSSSSDGGCLPPVLRDGGGSQYIELSVDPHTDAGRNGFLVKAVPHIPETGVLRLSWKMLHSGDGFGQYVGVFNRELTKGYAAFWTAGKSPTHGNVHLVRFDLAKSLLWSTRGADLFTVKEADAPHESQTLPLADFQLLINQGNGELKLVVDGKVVAEARDPSPISHFDKVVIHGNAGGLFDDITLEAD